VQSSCAISRSWCTWGGLNWTWDDAEVVRTLSGIHVWPIDQAVSRASTQLDFKGDPADELIAANACVANSRR
jgi:hypothetical protein